MSRSLVNTCAVLIAGALVAGCSSSSQQTPSAPRIAPPTTAVVGNVLAPDTVNVMVGANTFMVRVLGIQAPQSSAHGQPDGCGWPGALGYAQRTLANQQVTLVSDPNQPDGDPQSQGRSPRYLRLADGSDYGTSAVAAGWARADLDPQHPLQLDPQLRAAQAVARDANRALWGLCRGMSGPHVTALASSPSGTR